MAYRRRQAATRPSTFEVFQSSDDDGSSSPSPSLAAQAIRGSSAGRSSSLSSAYGEHAIGASRGAFNRSKTMSSDRDSTVIHKPTMGGNSDEATKSEGIWGALTRKARSILQEEGAADEERGSGRQHLQNISIPSRDDHQSPDGVQKRIGMLTSSLNYIGNALEEGLNKVEHRTADIIQETKKLNIRRKKDGGSQTQVNTISPASPQARATDYETQLKASRNVANAMAAKAKLLLRELKTVKADLAFAKERCAQLEDENKVLRESRDKGDHHDDDDLNFRSGCSWRRCSQRRPVWRTRTLSMPGKIASCERLSSTTNSPCRMSSISTRASRRSLRSTRQCKCRHHHHRTSHPPSLSLFPLLQWHSALISGAEKVLPCPQSLQPILGLYEQGELPCRQQ
ncbi:uncharacterized protein LOC144700885 isoform X2 [Wolffia australiana]